MRGDTSTPAGRRRPLARSPRVRLFPGLAVAIGLAACSSAGDDDPVATPLVDAPAPTSTPTFEPDDAPDDTTAATTTLVRLVADGPLAPVCGERLVVQLADLPSVEHGPLYSLLGAAPEVGTDAGPALSAPIVRPDGTVEETVLEIRPGGPATDFRPAVDLLATDDSIDLAEAALVGLLRDDAPVAVGIIALTDRNHDAVLWDPATVDVGSIEGLGDAGTDVFHFTGDPFVPFLVATGLLDGSQLVDGFDGGPAAFVTADGAIAQQADDLIDPFLYPTIEAWSRPVAFQSGADVGWNPYDDLLVVRPADVTGRSECLGRFVPIVQAAIVAYAASPDATNQLIVAARESLNPLTRVSADVLDRGAAAAVERGVFASGPDTVVGDLAGDRVTAAVEALGDLVEAPVADPGTLVDGRFLDRSISPG